MAPLISIIIPVYLVERYIKKCLDTIINQTYSNLEIIIIDDGSPDNSAKIINDYVKVDSRIKVIHKVNEGLSIARNVGLYYTTGEYVCFIDSDDYIELDMIEKVVTKLIESKSDVIIYGFYNEVVDNDELHIKTDPVTIDANDPNSLISSIGYAWNKMYNTYFLKHNEYTFDNGLSLVEDIVFNEKVLTNARKIEYLNSPFYHYIKRNRTTLVNQYYEDSFQLHKLGFESRKNVIYHMFGINSRTIATVATSYVSGICFCFSNMFHYQNNLKITNKYRKIKDMLYDKVTLEHIKFYRPKNFKNKVIKIMIRYKLTLPIYILYKIRNLKMMKAGASNTDIKIPITN